jgi:hypothetical protein
MEKERKRQLLLKKFEEGIKKGIKEVNTSELASSRLSNARNVALLTKVSDLYRVYMDDTFFSYEVTITREDEIGNTQRYVLTVSPHPSLQPLFLPLGLTTSHQSLNLFISIPSHPDHIPPLTLPPNQLYESYNSRPHMYWFVAKFYKKKGDSRPSVYRPSIAAGMLCREYGKFASFFETKTGIPWEQRLVRQGVPGKFQYQPPVSHSHLEPPSTHYPRVDM